jgi:hypothetical protein
MTDSNSCEFTSSNLLVLTAGDGLLSSNQAKSSVAEHLFYEQLPL